MFILVRYGEGPYGRVRCHGGTSVVTRFLHFWYMPIAPTAGHSVLVLREESHDEPGFAVPIPYDPRSILSAYGRSWGILLSVVVTGYAIAGHFHRGLAAATVVALLLVVAASFATLKPTLRERIEALAYAEVTGFPADLALMGENGLKLRHQLCAYLDEQISAGSADYRGVDNAPGRWVVAARQGQLRERSLLVVALAALRLDQALSRSRPDVPSPLRARVDHEPLRASLLRQLLQLDPTLQERAQAEVFEPPTLSPAIAWAEQHAPPFEAPPTPPRPIKPPPFRLIGAAVTAIGGGVLAAVCQDIAVNESLNLLMVIPALCGPVFGLQLLIFGVPRFSIWRVLFGLLSLGGTLLAALLLLRHF